MIIFLSSQLSSLRSNRPEEETKFAPIYKVTIADITIYESNIGDEALQWIIDLFEVEKG